MGRSWREVRAGVVAMKSGNADGAKDRQEGRDGMDTVKEEQPAGVPGRARQAGEARARADCVPTRTGRWGWVEPSVWTDRMLDALEAGVKGGKWYSLMDKVYRRIGS